MQGHVEDGANHMPPRRTLFIDEIPMPKRPEVEPHPSDREIYLTNLPVAHYTEEQIREWFKDFGTILDLHLLHDQTGRPSGNCYVRFEKHEEAAAWIGTQDGGVTACWSESERLLQGTHSVYRTDAVARLETALQALGFRNTSLLSEKVVTDSWSTSEGKQLHLATACSESELPVLQAAMSDALAQFHADVAQALGLQQHGIPATGSQLPQQQRQQRQQEQYLQQLPEEHMPPPVVQGQSQVLEQRPQAMQPPHQLPPMDMQAQPQVHQEQQFPLHHQPMELQAQPQAQQQQQQQQQQQSLHHQQHLPPHMEMHAQPQAHLPPPHMEVHGQPSGLQQQQPPPLQQPAAGLQQQQQPPLQQPAAGVQAPPQAYGQAYGQAQVALPQQDPSTAAPCGGNDGSASTTSLARLDMQISELDHFLHVSTHIEPSAGAAVMQAYQKYSQSLHFFLNEFSKLGDAHPQADILKQKITRFFEQVKRLKEKCSDQGATAPGVNDGSTTALRPPGPPLQQVQTQPTAPTTAVAAAGTIPGMMANAVGLTSLRPPQPAAAQVHPAAGQQMPQQQTSPQQPLPQQPLPQQPLPQQALHQQPLQQQQQLHLQQHQHQQLQQQQQPQLQQQQQQQQQQQLLQQQLLQQQPLSQQGPQHRLPPSQLPPNYATVLQQLQQLQSQVQQPAHLSQAQRQQLQQQQPQVSAAATAAMPPPPHLSLQQAAAQVARQVQAPAHMPHQAEAPMQDLADMQPLMT